MKQPKLQYDDEWNYKEILKDQSTIKDVAFRTNLGVLFEGDCTKVLTSFADESFDTIFADPPFNLGKIYGSKVNDLRETENYIEWCKNWINECERLLKPGGSLFIYNIPKWNIILGAHLTNIGLEFKHWVAVNIKLGLPIPNRLYPSHYSLLYYTKGKAKTFRRIRTPIQKCRHCDGEIKDYGGHRNAMNPNGVTLTDVWDDIPPVRHWKFKSKKRKANQLSTKLIRRVLDLSTCDGDVVLDPFGGSGTTFDVCESMGLNWVGIEIENVDVIKERLEMSDLDHHNITDYVER